MSARAAVRSLAAAARGAASPAHAGFTRAVLRPVASQQSRTFFGFGMERSAAEKAAEGKPTVPLYAREPEDDSAEYLYGSDLWSAEERADREALAREVHRMAHAEVQEKPTLEFYKRVFTTLMKYDDWRGVGVARNLTIESGVTLDDETIATLDAYMADAEARSYHMGGEW